MTSVISARFAPCGSREFSLIDADGTIHGVGTNPVKTSRDPHSAPDLRDRAHYEVRRSSSSRASIAAWAKSP
jgi:hypothetical protein